MAPASGSVCRGSEREKALPVMAGPFEIALRGDDCEWVLLTEVPSVSMPGDALLFQRLSVSTIGADRFHGRVRDGIGWVTDAMVTKQ